jgi:signal peptidase II
MTGVTRLGALALALAGVTLILDQLSKYWVMAVLRLPEFASAPLIGPVQLTRIWNQGISFGLFKAQADWIRWGMVSFSLIVAVVLINWVRRADRPLTAIALGLVIGGAIGNAIDRARFGAVVDFIDASALYFPWIFNIADAGISVGVALLLIDTFRPQRPA